MDQDALVNEEIDGGKRLIEALAVDGLEVRVAFWAKPTEDERWHLYLASPFVDDKGPAAAYRLVQGTLGRTADVWIDPFDIRVIGMNDSLAEAALDLTKPKAPDSLFAVRNPRPYPGMTRFGGSSLGGISVDGAYIYPPLQPAASPK
jgi:hypothetical protein